MSVEPNLPQVEVFMQAHCGSCKRVEQFLRKRCVAFSVRDVDQDAAALDELISRGFMSTPVTRIGTHWVAGYKRSLIETLLEASRNSLGHHHG